MRIAGTSVADHLKIIFTHLCEKDWDTEYWFIVNLSSREYESTLSSAD